MISAAKSLLKRHWPALKLRVILFAVLFFVAALPGISAIFLRVYENTLVRQTQAELAAQGAALVAAAEVLWPGAHGLPGRAVSNGIDPYGPEGMSLDLRTSPILPERPPPLKAATPPDPEAVEAGRSLAPIVVQTGLSTLAGITLLDSHGQVILGDSPGGSYARLPEVKGALEGKNQTVLRRIGAYRPVHAFEWLSRASALRVHHARPIVVGGRTVGVVLLARSSRALFRGIYEDRGKIMFGVAAIFATLLVLTGLVSRGVALPIEALRRAAREVAAGHGAIPETPPTAAVEIRDLYEEFRLMSEAIARRSRYLRDFAAAVSHEFKTPLAGITGAIELLQDHADTMSDADRRRFLANISADSARLTQLVTRLLDLARADMERPGLDAAAEVARPVRQVADALRSEGFPVVVDLPDDLPRVAPAEATIESVLTTLIVNSRQAGASQAAISARASDNGVLLVVQDDGPGIPEADRDRLFEPFFTSRRADGGTGLGLPIARSLLAASNGEIRLVDCAKGARFEVTLPISTAE